MQFAVREPKKSFHQNKMAASSGENGCHIMWENNWKRSPGVEGPACWSILSCRQLQHLTGKLICTATATSNSIRIPLRSAGVKALGHGLSAKLVAAHPTRRQCLISIKLAQLLSHAWTIYLQALCGCGTFTLHFSLSLLICLTPTLVHSSIF